VGVAVIKDDKDVRVFEALETFPAWHADNGTRSDKAPSKRRPEYFMRIVSPSQAAK
jgi:hypothetical protein